MRLAFVTLAKAGAQRKKSRVWIPAFAGMTMLWACPLSAQDKTPPYWASIASGEAMMRTGPGKNYPGTWLYKRRDLPIRVVKTYPNWRLIEDPDGTRGWMLVTLLSDRRTAIVKPGEPRQIHERADESSRVAYLAESGVVGRIEKCANGWCRIRIGKREGHIHTSDIWGVNDSEVVD
jgi:SH3-like domain-containing protein